MGPGCTRACPYCDIDFDKAFGSSTPRSLNALAKLWPGSA